ncbi:MAG: LruC domain-containing protein [Prevotella sp.]
MSGKSLVKWSMATMVFVAVCSCGDKDLYDREAYLNQVKQAFPVANVDPQHDWSSVAAVRLTAHLSMNRPGTYMVRVYSAMPQSGQSTELLASAEVVNGGVFTTNLNYRVNSPMLYIAVEDERGFLAVYPREITGQSMETQVGDAVKDAGSSALQAPRMIASTREFPDFPKEGEYATDVPADAHPIDQYAADHSSGSLVSEYYVDASSTAFNPWQGNVKIYFKPGTYTVNCNMTIPYNTQIYFLPGSKITINQELWCTQSGTAIYIAEGAEVTVSKKCGLGIGVYNRGKLSVQEFELNNSGVCTNQGSVSVVGKFRLANTSCYLVNSGTLVADSLELASGAAMHNLDSVNVAGRTHLSSYNDTWVNDGTYVTGSLDCEAGTDQFINNCRLKVNGKFSIWNGSSSTSGFRQDALASTETEEFYINTSRVFLGSQSLFKVNKTATMNCGNPGYGIHGTGTDASKPAVFQAKDIVMGSASTENQVTYSGYLWVASDTHFSRLKPDGRTTYNVADDKVSFAIGANDAATTIPASKCTPGYNQGNTPVTPPVNDGMTMIHCYEDNFPEPGDYDFNDVVLGLKMEKCPRRSGSKRDTLVIKVEVKAVGATKSIGAAIRLKDVKSRHVSGDFKLSSEADRKMFNFYDIEIYNRTIKPNPEGSRKYLTAINSQDLVIPLFNDAHYAITGGLKENGDVKRRFYNTVADRSNAKGEVIGADMLPENEYKILFTDAQAFNQFVINDVDLFIIEEYNGAFFEVHTYQYKQDEVVHNWRNGSDAYADNYPWGLAVPSASFRYPIEWTAIGSCLTNNVFGGAYQTAGHSFIEWARDHTKATDWYNYPTSGLVY